ncbi:MAG TPA: hypothetical protein DCM86_16430 [Verrucomicrobiales bacterium]|nr:hypothetical protein [Verrucomicrobiales bacterium]
MSSHFDASEFVDDDLHPAAAKSTFGSSSPAASPLGVGERKAPSREEVESKVNEMHQRLSELKTEQQRLERERAQLEETRRRQSEFSTGRQEMIQNLTRGVALLEEAEINLRRDAEQRARALAGMREALDKVVTLTQDHWNKENFEVELTRSLTVIDNARMEWNSARVKFGELTGNSPSAPGSSDAVSPGGSAPGGAPQGFPTNYAGLCKLGLAINWPLVVLGLAIFLMLWLRR